MLKSIAVRRAVLAFLIWTNIENLMKKLLVKSIGLILKQRCTNIALIIFYQDIWNYSDVLNYMAAMGYCLFSLFLESKIIENYLRYN